MSLAQRTGKRGRPRKSMVESVIGTPIPIKPTITKMIDFTYDENLFIPMPTDKKIDTLLSADNGMMRGTNMAFIGDPGVGKTTVLLDVLADLSKKGNKVLFISAEMNQIDMVPYTKRFPKFSQVPILFMGDYADQNPIQLLEETLQEGYDVVLIDSFAEVSVAVVDYFGGTTKSAETRILNLLDKHNKATNDSGINTTFMIIQQVTKGGKFAGSNRFKHMLTSMFHMEFDGNGERYIYFSKNRRGGLQNKLYFHLRNKNAVAWLHDEPLAIEI